MLSRLTVPLLLCTAFRIEAGLTVLSDSYRYGVESPERLLMKLMQVHVLCDIAF